jgi:hypothetical protein
MSTRTRKRQKTDPSPVKPDTKTLFHFFSKRASNGIFSGRTEASPPKTDSGSGSINDEPRRKSDIGIYIPARIAVKNEMTPPRTTMDVVQTIKSDPEPIQFEASFTEVNDTCSPTKEEQDDIESFGDFDFRDDEYRDKDFRDEELDGFPYEDIDDIEDDVDNPDIKEESTDTYTDTTVDEGPSCPFCNFSFKGLSENVQPVAILRLMIVNNAACKPMS